MLKTEFARHMLKEYIREVVRTTERRSKEREAIDAITDDPDVDLA
jgi:hypothetical protein